MFKYNIKKLLYRFKINQEFVELINSYLETILSTTDIIEEDMIYNKLVLNLRASDNAVSVIKINPPYNLMVDLEKIPLGWDFKDHVRNLFEDYEWLKDFNSELAKLILEKNSMSLKAMA